MSGETLRLGPWIAGLNLAADPTQITDEECIECLNLELDIDGSMVNRPPIVVFEDSGSDNDRFLIFGSTNFGLTSYLFGTRSGATYFSSDVGVSWTELNPGGLSRECKTMVHYAGMVWFPATPGSANGGFNWDPSSGATAVAAMPRGESAVVHKERMYICPGPTATANESRLHFSDPADFTTWTEFIDVSQGDGTTLNAVIVYQDNLLLFKSQSTFVLAYDLDPADAILREINPVVGIRDNFSVVQHENTVYCISGQLVYEIVNFDFGLLNLKVPFVFDNSSITGTTARYEDISLSLLGDRLVVRFFNRTYVFGLRTRTWSEWRKTDDTSTIEWHIFGPLIRIRSTSPVADDTYYTGYSFDVSSGGYKLFSITDGFTASAVEGVPASDHIMECILTTKDYDMGDPVRFKRLFWWGADLISGNDIIAALEPITLAFQPTWDDLQGTQWGDLGTWGTPLQFNPPTQTTIDGDANFATSKATKFNKGVRFRKVNFSVKITTTGSSTQISKIFSYLALISVKQLITQRAN